MSKLKESENERKLQMAIQNAVYVASEVELKSAIGKKELAIISTNASLYERLLKKYPKESVVSGTKRLGKWLAGIGIAISVLSFGLFSFIGLPMAGVGATIGLTGSALDDCKDYQLFLDYDKHQVLFLKTSGKPCIDLPKNVSSKKLMK